MADTLQLMQEALEDAGITFIPADEMAGPGVRLTEMGKRRQPSRRSGKRPVQPRR